MTAPKLSEVEAFRAKKAAAVTRAEARLRSAESRLETALQEYGAEVERHEERGDGFFSSTYLEKRKEAVLARKFLESVTSALATARAEAEAPILPLEATSPVPQEGPR